MAGIEDDIQDLFGVLKISHPPSSKANEWPNPLVTLDDMIMWMILFVGVELPAASADGGSSSAAPLQVAGAAEAQCETTYSMRERIHGPADAHAN